MIQKFMTKKSEEPTITEVHDSMLRCFSYFEERFNLVDARMDQRFGAVDTRLDNVDSNVTEINARLGVIERDISKVKVAIADLQEDVTTLSVAFDRDSVTLINHDVRIERLEDLAKVA